MNYRNCPKRGYCEFVVIKDTKGCKVERCKFCKRKEIYRVKNGRIDSAKYARDHVRDFCQPVGATKGVYLQVYGRKRLEASLAMRRTASKNNSIEEGVYQAKQALRHARRMECQGRTEAEIQKIISETDYD
jgi:hypothetical protein